MTSNGPATREVVVTGTGCAGPWGVSREPPPAGSVSAGAVPVRSGTLGFRPFTVVVADPSALETLPEGLSRRQLRYLARNSRLALAACGRALDDAAFSREPADRESLACLVASTRGPTDPETTLAMIRAASSGDPAAPPSLRAALDEYNRHRLQVQYLMSMETAVVGHLTAALGARGPAHALTAPGLAGGMQALARGVLAVARGPAPAALACGVLTAEDEPGVAELLELAGAGTREVGECAAAVLLEDAGAARRSGRRPLCRLEIVEESFRGAVGEEIDPAPTVDERVARPFAGAARAMLALADACTNNSPTTLRLRGALGHRLTLAVRPAGESS